MVILTLMDGHHGDSNINGDGHYGDSNINGWSSW